MATQSLNPTDSPSSEQSPYSTDRILLVDDEDIIGDVCKRVLQQIGYQVRVAKNGKAAVAILKEGRELFDLVITDFAMPEMTGADLAREIRDAVPGLPIILFTAYPELIIPERMEFLGIKALMYKPVGRQELIDCVRRVIDESRGKPSPGE